MLNVEKALDDIQAGRASGNFQPGPFLDQLNEMRGTQSLQSFLQGMNADLQRINSEIDKCGLLPAVDIGFDAVTQRFKTEKEDRSRNDFVGFDGQGDILPKSEAGIGHRLWEETKWKNSCDDGVNGCAASVSRVLQESGFDCAQSSLVGGSPKRRGLVDQLIDYGWTPTSSPKPGDIVYKPDVHIGIVGLEENGAVMVYNNSSAEKRWIKESLEQSSLSGGLYLQPPAGTVR